MHFNVSGLVLEGIGASRTYEIDDVLRAPGQEPERVTGTVEMIRTRAGVLVRAHLRMVEPEVCSRCLNPLEEAVALEFEAAFQSMVDARTGAHLPQPSDRDAFLIDERHTLDLSEAVRQYREVSLEMQPLCRPDCKGLCPTCGKDLNLGPCDCESPPEESPWSKLAALKQRAASEGKE